MPLEPDAENKSAHTSDDIPADASSNSGASLPPVVPPPNPPQTPRAPYQPSDDAKRWWQDRKYVLELCGFGVLFLYTIFAGLQWWHIRWANTMTREALNGSNSSLQQTLDRMVWQIQETHEIAKQTLAQEQQTSKIADETKNLAIATRNESSAAKSSAETAASELTMSNRPWVSVEVEIVGSLHHVMFPGVGGDQLQLPLKFHYKNTGRTPATAVTSTARIVQTRFGYFPLADHATLSEVHAFMAKGGKPIEGTNPDAELRALCSSDRTPAKVRRLDGFNWGRLVGGEDTYDDFLTINTPITQFDHPGLTSKGRVATDPMPLSVIVCTTYGLTFNDDTHQIGAVYILGRRNPASPGGMDGIDPFDMTPIAPKDLGLVRSVANAGFSN